MIPAWPYKNTELQIEGKKSPEGSKRFQYLTYTIPIINHKTSFSGGNEVTLGRKEGKSTFLILYRLIHKCQQGSAPELIQCVPTSP
jgi:hypothetical protein